MTAILIEIVEGKKTQAYVLIYFMENLFIS